MDCKSEYQLNIINPRNPHTAHVHMNHCRKFIFDRIIYKKKRITEIFFFENYLIEFSKKKHRITAANPSLTNSSSHNPGFLSPIHLSPRILNLLVGKCTPK